MSGNPGKRPLPPNEPRPTVGAPDAPEFLSERARGEWERMVPLLLGMGVLALVDRAALAGYCVNYARWVEAEEHLAKMGPIVKAPKSNVPMQNPFLSVAQNALDRMDKFGAKFGYSPQDRARVATAGQSPSANPFAELG